jgi:hypothetical protein
MSVKEHSRKSGILHILYSTHNIKKIPRNEKPRVISNVVRIKSYLSHSCGLRKLVESLHNFHNSV